MRTNKNFKGQALIVPAIILIIVLIGIIAYLDIPLIKSTQTEKDIEVRAQMHAMGNALDAAKLYMETSLAYSTYQACYGTLRKGGWDSIPSGKAYQGYSLWEPPEQHPTMLEFKASFESSIKENLGLYRGTKAYTFLSDYYVNLPSYASASAYVDEDTGKMSVRAGAESNLYIEKTQESGEHVRLEKYGFLQGEYAIDCYGIYAKGLEVYALAKDSVARVFGETSAVLPKTLAQGESLDAKMSQYKSQFSSSARQALNALAGTQGDYEVSVDVKSAELICVQGDVTPSGSPITCRSEVYAKFEVTNMKDEQMFPVYDGYNVIMSPMTLVFIGKFAGS